MDALSLSSAQAALLLRDSHGIAARNFRALGSELASTFRVSSELGELAVKIQRTNPFEAAQQRWRADISEHLTRTDHPVPEAIRASSGALVGFGRVESEPSTDVAIIVTRWINAAPYATLDLPVTFGHVLGRTAAQVQLTLAERPAPPHPIAHPWAAHTMAETIQHHLAGTTLPEVHAAGSHALDIYNRHVESVAAHLPWSLVHQDLHDDNVLATPDGRIAAIIDFDDMLVGWRVAEPAIASAYFARTVGDPIAGIRAVAAGWDAVVPLTPAERSALVPLAAMRLALNAVIWDSRSAGDRHGYAADRSRGSLPAFAAVASHL